MDMEHHLENQLCDLFSSRDTVDGAIRYAMHIAKSEDFPTDVMMTVIMVYHNTLINQLINQLTGHHEEEDNEQD